MRLNFAALVSLIFLVPLGCAVSTESFQPESTPVDLVRASSDLDTLFMYCAGVPGDAPELAPLNGVSKDAAHIIELALSLRNKTAQDRAYVGRGCLGENNRGYWELRECAAMSSPEETNALQKIMAGINKDRKALYYELALYYHNGDLSVSVIEEMAAAKFAAMALPGEWIQLPSLGLRFKQFMESPLGVALGDSAKADTWVRIP